MSPSSTTTTHRSRPSRWPRSYALLAKWTLLRLRYMVPVIVGIQLILSVGIVIGFAFLIPGIEDDPQSALYLSTGAPTLALITVGMVMAPAMLAQDKLQGIFDYQRTLPVPRTAMMAADATVWVVAALPGVVVGLIVAALRFDLDLRLSPLVVPAMLLVAVACLAVGTAMAYLTPPMVTQMLTNLVVFVALMFSPINFPADRLPDWLAAVHGVLPFTYMAQAIRETLATPADGVSATPFLVLGAWCVIGLAVTQWVVNRRG